MHQGVDFGSAPGKPIYASADGAVAAAGDASGFGQWIVLDHNIGGKMWSTVYGHMFPQDVLVKTGDKVEPGQTVAIMEAMKMENILRAPKAATVKATPVKAGDSVAVDQGIVEFE